MTNGPDASEIDRLDRVLGRGERLFALAATFLVCLVTSALFALTLLALFRSLGEEEDMPYAAVALLLALLGPIAWWSGRLCYRELRGRPRKPSPVARLFLGLLVFAGGLTALWSGVQAEGPSDPRAHDLYLAAVLLLAGGAWAMHALRQLRAGTSSNRQDGA